MRFPLTVILSLFLAVTAHGQTVEQRLAALERRVGALEQGGIAIDVPPANVQAVTPVKAISAYHAIHLRVGEEVTEQSVIRWLTDAGIERRGFNASFVRGDGAIVTCYVDGKTYGVWSMSWPAAEAAKPLAVGSEIGNLPAGTYQLQIGTYTLTGEASLNNVTLLGVGPDKTIVKHANINRGWRILHISQSAIWNISFVNDYAYNASLPLGKNPARKECDGLFDCGDDVTFVNDRATGFNDTWYCGGSRIARHDCEAVDPIGNMAWLAGSDLTSYGSKLNNSRIEHGERGGGWHWLAINDAEIGNLDPADVNDEAKGTTVLQVGDRGYVWRSRKVSAALAGAGPLPVNAGGRIDESTTRLVYEDCEVPVELWGGLDGFRITNTPTASWYQRDARIVKNGIVPASSIVPMWATGVRKAA